MKLYIPIFLIASILALGQCQVYNWDGDWQVWNTIPYHNDINKYECCVPDNVKITKNAANQNLVSMSISISNVNPRCPLLHQNITINEDVTYGNFQDDKFNGFRAIFRPNNNTILMYPGTIGNCKWELGGKNSFQTNSTEANRNASWDGKWNFTAYSLIPNQDCCLPLSPITVRKDNLTNTIAGSLTFSKHSKCPLELKGRIINYNYSIDGGAYERMGKDLHGYLLSNGSILERYGNCIAIINKIPAKVKVNPVSHEVLDKLFLAFNQLV